ncbi:Ac92-like protein [Penaeus monodon nudivirus]|uniref:Sulfhydryl oxidase n=1 Tax=Penaeus monodon nudivirus TaxID=1529056 RepID=A0A076FIU5_9VIRU|nr:Ac92-like protein [Penaeus monodon nudivirus]AII15796.1 Ac92-like protein [Penaeus monodon nudivirus]
MAMFDHTYCYANKESYKLLNPNETMKSFKISTSRVFAYIKKIIPRPELKIAGRYLLQYQCELYNLVYNVIHNYSVAEPLKDPNAFLTTSYDKLMDALNIKERYTPTDIQFTKDVWGPIYWNFLHLLSILCNKEEQKKTFAYIMMNFNLVLMCSACAFNFRSKKPFMLTMSMLITGDVITNLYNFHNLVNKALHKPYFDYSDFLDTYKLRKVESEVVDTSILFVSLITK